MFIIISQSIKISTKETIMLCSWLYLVFISIYLYNIILFKIHNEFDEVDYQFYHGINSSFTVRVYLLSIIPIILLCLPYQIEIQNFSIDIWVPYYNTDKIHRIYNNFPWNLDKRVHLNLL